MVVVLLVGFLSTTLNCRWCANVAVTTQPEPPLRFVRTGPQRHLLVLSSSNSSTVQKARHQLQQMAANQSWFLYHTSVLSHSSLFETRLFEARSLAQFNDVVLNQLPRHKLSKAQRDALALFEDEGGKVTSIVGDLSAASLE